MNWAFKDDATCYFVSEVSFAQIENNKIKGGHFEYDCQFLEELSNVEAVSVRKHVNEFKRFYQISEVDSPTLSQKHFVENLNSLIFNNNVDTVYYTGNCLIEKALKHKVKLVAINRKHRVNFRHASLACSIFEGFKSMNCTHHASLACSPCTLNELSQLMASSMNLADDHMKSCDFVLTKNKCTPNYFPAEFYDFDGYESDDLFL